MSAMDEYRAALQRLIDDTPQILARGGKINNDTVALEAGRTRGSIKKSRSEFSRLIDEIKAAASRSNTGQPDDRLRSADAKIKMISQELSRLKQEHSALLSKYLSILHYNHQLQRENKKLGGSENLLGESVKLGKELN